MKLSSAAASILFATCGGVSTELNPSSFVAAKEHDSPLRLHLVTAAAGEETMERELKKNKKRPKAPQNAKRPKTPKSSKAGKATVFTTSPSSQSTDKIAVVTASPSSEPTGGSTASPTSSEPTGKPSFSSQPSGKPSSQPSGKPSSQPSGKPSSQPSGKPSSQPSGKPSSQPSGKPSSQPSGEPSSQPSGEPSSQPSGEPSSPPTNPFDWQQKGIDIDGKAAGDFFGHSVSFSNNGTILAIGGRYNDDNGNDSGHVRVYEWKTDTSPPAWQQKGDDIKGEAAGDESGWRVSLSGHGTVLAIGASFNDGNGEDSGHVRVYEWKADTSPPAWQQKGDDIDGEAAGDQSGSCVSMSSDGTILAIGGRYNDDNGSNSGHVRVYEWKANASPPAWQKKGDDIDGEASWDFSGSSFSLSSDGTVLAIGARYNDENGDDSGHVRVYEWKANASPPAWQKKGIDIDGEAAGDNLGWSVSLSSDGTILAIGARKNDDNGDDSGHVRVYEWNDTSPPAWQQMGDDIDGEAAGDFSGYSVSLSSDGTVLAIGAINNDGNGTDSGHVRVYEWNIDTSPPAWQQMGTDIDGEAAGDQSGDTVSLSSDGTVLAIGAPGNDGNGYYSGHVRVYEFTN